MASRFEPASDRRFRRSVVAVVGACVLTLVVAGHAAAAPGDGASVGISSGESHSVSLGDDGTVSAWGRNDLGQLGNGTTNWRYGGTNTIDATPTSVVLADGTRLDDVTRVHGGYNCSLAIRSDGSVWSWGSDMCRPSDTWPASSALLVAEPVKKSDGTQLTGAVSLSGGVDHGIAVLGDGTAWSWGSNGLGTGLPAQGTAQQVLTGVGTPLTGVAEVASKSGAPLALLSSGAVYQWSTGYATPVELSAGVPIADATGLAAGVGHYLVIRPGGEVWAWGLGTGGRLGNGDVLDQSFPVQVLTAPGTPLTNIVEVDAGSDFSMARTADGTVYGWGSINGSSYAQPITLPAGVTGVQEIAAGGFQSLILADGLIYNLGSNWAGQLADPSGTDSPTWIKVNTRPAVSEPVQVLAGDGSATPVAGVHRDGVGTPVLLELNALDLDAGQSATPWVEVMPYGASFSGACGVASATTYSGPAFTTTGSRQLVRVPVSGLVDGARYTWRSCTVDAAGGAGTWSAAAAAAFVVDASGPLPLASSAQADDALQTVTFTVGGADAIAGLHAAAYSFDDGVTWQESGQYVVSNVPHETTVRVTARIRDALGNISAAIPLEATVQDVFGPAITLTRAIRDVTPRRDLLFSIVDEETAVARTTARFRGKPVTIRDGKVRARDLPEGRGILRVEAFDTEGNIGRWSRFLVIDRTAPTIANPPRAVFGRTHQLRLTDNVSGTVAKSARVTLPDLGPNVSTIAVRDRFGNRASRRVRIVRHLSLSKPHLNSDVRVTGANITFDANQHWIRESFRFISYSAPWYARTEKSPALVREAQWRLRAFGYLSPAFELNGKLDIPTIRAVQRYQADKGLPLLGTIGPRTRRALDRDLLAARFDRSWLREHEAR